MNKSLPEFGSTRFLPGKRDSTLEKPDALPVLDFFSQKESLFQLQEFSEEHINMLYTFAYEKYTTEKYEDAEKIFFLLCLLAHHQGRNWMGLGAARQMRQEYESAASAYQQAVRVDTTSPAAGFHLAECLLKLHAHTDAAEALQHTLDRCGENPKYAHLRNCAELLQSMLRRIAIQRSGA